MAYRVRDEVALRSRSKHGARTFLLEIASTAHDDGVGWRRQGWLEGEGEKQMQRTLQWRVNLTPRQLTRITRTLQLLDELEIVWALDGRRRFYIYRVLVGFVRSDPVDYDRGLPELEGRFWTSEELRLPKEERPATGHFAPWIDRGRPDILSGRQEAREGVDDQTSATSTTRQIVWPHARASRIRGSY